MDVCSDGHDEIVHDSRKCPFCAYISTRDDQEHELDMEIEDLMIENDGLKKEIEKLEEYNQKLLFFRGQKEN